MDVGELGRPTASGQWGWKRMAAASVGAAVVLTMVAATTGADGGLVRLVAGGVLLVAGLLLYFYWRVRPTATRAWTVGATVLLATEVISRAGIDAASQEASHLQSWSVLLDLTSTGVVLGLLLVASRVVFTPDPLLLGLGLGLGLAVARVVGLALPWTPDVSGLEATAVSLVVLLGYLAIGREVWRDEDLPLDARLRLGFVTALIGLGHPTGVWTSYTWLPDSVVSLALAVAAFAWLQVTVVLLGESLEEQREQGARLERALDRVEADAKTSRELLHQVRSMVAGVGAATRLLHDHDLEDTTRIRLEHTVRAELDRLERLVTQRSAAVSEAAVDLDGMLDHVLQAHRARGRTIEWNPSGARVSCGADDVAEVMDILLDNVATHAHGAPSRIDVSPDEDHVRITVRDHGPGVPEDMRERIFEWGVSGPRSHGEGIGLNRARRLVMEHGGSLSLAQDVPTGSAFVIRLPAPRKHN